ncbi:hypothetical protein BGZ68_003752 [Mortierella alpina]|nr:hypothetical protein BGZ68_003752 [Mortierella alpina]
MTSSTEVRTEPKMCSYRRWEYQCEETKIDSGGYCQPHRSMATKRDGEKKEVPKWITESSAPSKVEKLIEDKYIEKSKAWRLETANDSLLSQIEILQKEKAHLQAKVDQLSPVKQQFRATEDVMATLQNMMSALRVMIEVEDLPSPQDDPSSSQPSLPSSQVDLCSPQDNLHAPPPLNVKEP